MIDAYIKNAVAAGKIAHALIIESEDAKARKDAALSFAMNVMCDTKNACGTCHNCKQIIADSHPDLIQVTHEKEQTLSVKEIREQVCDTVTIRPFANEYKIYIIDDSQLMPPGAQNALLKTIEEPPEYAVLMLLCDNANRLLETIRSRCIILKLERNEALDVDEETYLENIEILSRASDADLSEIQRSLRLVAERGSSGAEAFCSFALCWYKDVLIYKKTGGEGKLVFEDERDVIADIAAVTDYTKINKAIESVEKTRTRLKFNVNQDLSLELMMLSL